MSPETDLTIREEILKRLRIVRIATFVLGGLFLILAVYLVVRLGQINSSLCTLRSDLQDRVARAQDFLDNPNKYPGIKVPPEVIRQQIEGQQKTVDALNDLHC